MSATILFVVCCSAAVYDTAGSHGTCCAAWYHAHHLVTEMGVEVLQWCGGRHWRLLTGPVGCLLLTMDASDLGTMQSWSLPC